MNDLIDRAPADVLEAWKRLNPKQQAFVCARPGAASHEEAMVTAGYAAQTARKKAGLFAKHPDVAKVLQYLIDAVASQSLASARDSVDRLVEEMANIALADPLAMFDERDCLKPLRDWPEELRRAVASVETLEVYEGQGKDRVFIGYTKKIRFWNKIQAADTIAKLRRHGVYAPEEKDPGAPVNVYGGVVVLPPKESGRGRGITRGAVIEGELVQGATVRQIAQDAPAAT